MKDTKLKMPEEIISEGSAKYMHSIIHHENPEDIVELLKFPRSRTCVDLTFKKIPKSERLRRCAIYAGLSNYNRIPQELKGLSPKEMRRALKKTKLHDAKKMN